MSITNQAQWERAGAPHELAVPIAEIKAEIERRLPRTSVGTHLGTLGDTRHLSANPPQDHTPYSATGWPEPNIYPFVCACDWSGVGYVAFGQHFIHMKTAGLATWVKYVNLLGKHYQWEPGETVGPSTDGPTWTHLSVRSDWTHTSIAHSWPTTSKKGGAGTWALQQLLNLNMGTSIAEDGKFGPITDSSLRAFQTHARLAVDGVAGPATRVALAVRLP